MNKLFWLILLCLISVGVYASTQTQEWPENATGWNGFVIPAPGNVNLDTGTNTATNGTYETDIRGTWNYGAENCAGGYPCTSVTNGTYKIPSNFINESLLSWDIFKWRHNISTAGIDSMDSVIDSVADSSGNFYVLVRYTPTPWNPNEAMVVSRDENGTLRWARTYVGPRNSSVQPYVLQLSTDETLLYAGVRHPDYNVSVTDIEVSAYRTSDGAPQWAGWYKPNNSTSQVYGMATDGTYLVLAGNRFNAYRYSPGNYDAIFISVNPTNGALYWKNTFYRNVSAATMGYDVVFAPDGKLFVNGRMPTDDIFIFRLDPSTGNMLANKTYDGGSSDALPGGLPGGPRERSLAAGNNAVYMTANSKNSTGGDSDIVVLAYTLSNLANYWTGPSGNIRFNNPGFNSNTYDVEISSDYSLLVTTGDGVDNWNTNMLTLFVDPANGYSGTTNTVAYDGPVNDSDWSNRVAIDGLNNVLITGACTMDLVNYYSDNFNIKYDSSANPNYTRTYDGSTGNDDGKVVVVGPNAAYYSVDSEPTMYIGAWQYEDVEIGYQNQGPSPPGPGGLVPEFTSITLLLAALVALGGIFAFRRYR